MCCHQQGCSVPTLTACDHQLGGDHGERPTYSQDKSHSGVCPPQQHQLPQGIWFGLHKTKTLGVLQVPLQMMVPQ